MKRSGNSVRLLAAACTLSAAAGAAAQEGRPVIAPARVEKAPVTLPDSGGATTVPARGRRSYSLPLANISPENLKANTIGNSFFNENWTAAPSSAQARDGLGPFFHARSCSACHLFDGRGAPPEPGGTMTSLLLRLSVPGADAHGGPLPDPVYGSQLAPRALPGLEPEAEVEISYEDVTVSFPDGTSRTLQKPLYRVKKWNYGSPGEGIMLSPRVAPAVFGLGLLETVHDQRLLQFADPDDADGDGISGRVNRVWNPATQRMEIGRFGWKAGTSSLRAQAAAAAAEDMGLTSSAHPRENHTVLQTAAAAYPSGGAEPGGDGPEISDRILDSLVIYLQTLAPPARRDTLDPVVRQGQDLFHKVRCIACHLPALRTNRENMLPELRSHTIRPYTDLLLHDMGPDLADGRPDYLAGSSEWRTPPLWGLGLLPVVNGHTRLLHDGRARDAEEAILWHGGEAAASRQAYMELSAAERAAVLRFLQSL